MSRSNEMERACEEKFDRSALSLHDDIVQANALHGKRHFVLNLPLDHEGKTICVPLTLTERFRILYLPGGFGIGPHLYSTSLLPGEKMRLETVRSTKTSQSSDEEVSDTHELATEMASALTSEQQARSGSSSSHEFGVDVHAEADFGFVSGSVDTNYKGQWSSSREDFSKTVSSASRKAASSVSAKRSLVVRQATETAVEEKTLRVIENFNRAHPVDYNFFQLLRRFHTSLEIYDLRITLGWSVPEIGIIVRGTADANLRAMAAKGSMTFSPVFDIRRGPLGGEQRKEEKYSEAEPLKRSAHMFERVESFDKASQIRATAARLGISEKAMEAHTSFNENMTKASAPHEDCLPDFYFGVPYSPEEFKSAIQTLALRRNEFQGFVDDVLKAVDEYSEELFKQYQSDRSPEDYGLPVQIPQNDIVIATNGTHVEAMLGICSAAEAYIRAQRDIELEHRDAELRILQERQKREELINQLIESGQLTPNVSDTFSVAGHKVTIQIKVDEDSSTEEIEGNQ